MLLRLRRALINRGNSVSPGRPAARKGDEARAKESSHSGLIVRSWRLDFSSFFGDGETERRRAGGERLSRDKACEGSLYKVWPYVQTVSTQEGERSFFHLSVPPGAAVAWQKFHFPRKNSYTLLIEKLSGDERFFGRLIDN